MEPTCFVRNYKSEEEYCKKINNLRWKGHFVTSMVSKSVQLEESALLLWVRIKIYAFLSFFSSYYNDKYHKHIHRLPRTYSINLIQETASTIPQLKAKESEVTDKAKEPEVTGKAKEPEVTGKAKEPEVTDKAKESEVTGKAKEPEETGKPAESPFRECFFKTLPEDLSTLGPLSDLESKALKSVLTLTKLLELKIPLYDLPRFPIPINSIDGLWSLLSSEKMKKIEHPISFGFDGDGWPFIVIVVLDAEELATARSIFLYCGPLGSHCIQWGGWWESHNGLSCPSFFNERIFINRSGELIDYPQEIQGFKDLLTNGSSADFYGKKWILKR